MPSSPSARLIDGPPAADPMERLAVVAATYRQLPTEQREALAQRLGEIDDAFSERVMLHTCHRVEVIGVLLGQDPPPLPAGVSLSRGADAVERVLLVAGGLDSAVLAEEQVLGQVREAYQTALARRTTGPITNELLRRALRFGKRVRAEAQPGMDRSLADRAATWALAGLSEADHSRPSVLVLGSGEMGRLLAHRFAAAGIPCTIASRSAERGSRIAAGLPPVTGASHAGALLPDALADAAHHRLVAIATRSGAERLDVDHLGGAPWPLVIDLSSPGAVTPVAASLLGDRLLDLDRLGQLATNSPLSPAAEQRLRAELEAERDRFGEWLAARASGDGIAMLRSHAEQVRHRHLERLRRRADLSPEQLSAIESMSSALISELLHVPTLQLRRDPEAADRVRELFGFGR